MYGHGGHLENAPFHWCWDGYPVWYVFQHNNQPNEINAPNILDLVVKLYVGLSWDLDSILGTKMGAILDFVNKSWTYVAELYFIGFVNPENISLGTKSIFLAGLVIEISQKKKDLVTIRRPFWKTLFFFIVWTLLERVTRSNIFSHIKIYQIKSRNLICQTWPRNSVLGLSWDLD